MFSSNFGADSLVTHTKVIGVEQRPNGAVTMVKYTTVEAETGGSSHHDALVCSKLTSNAGVDINLPALDWSFLTDCVWLQRR